MSSNNNSSNNRRGRGGRRGGRPGRQGNHSTSNATTGPATVNGTSNSTKSTPKKDAANDNTDEGVCWICAEPVKFYALSECNHRTCHVCALRLRALYKRTDCTFCKVALVDLGTMGGEVANPCISISIRKCRLYLRNLPPSLMPIIRPMIYHSLIPSFKSRLRRKR